MRYYSQPVHQYQESCSPSTSSLPLLTPRTPGSFRAMVSKHWHRAGGTGVCAVLVGHRMHAHTCTHAYMWPWAQRCMPCICTHVLPAVYAGTLFVEVQTHVCADTQECIQTGLTDAHILGTPFWQPLPSSLLYGHRAPGSLLFPPLLTECQSLTTLNPHRFGHLDAEAASDGFPAPSSAFAAQCARACVHVCAVTMVLAHSPPVWYFTGRAGHKSGALPAARLLDTVCPTGT